MPLRAADTQPNILYVVADDLGWADVGFHGSKIKTPNIDRLCREGIERTRPTLRLRLQQPQ
ncbi:MAG: sulfatase-like hydrolase/transferase [Planctomycetes bacterium]|nr:sulfatase-like hydrolase/transferase [Planctomycetota bacterium]